MGKWIAGIIAAIIAGLAVAYGTNIIAPKDSGGGSGTEIPRTPPEDDDGKDKADDGPVTVVMGPLEEGINRGGQDLTALEKAAANAPLCAEMCRTEEKCDSVTYVKSTGMCWMKSGVPAATANGDMISAVKIRKKASEAAM